MIGAALAAALAAASPARADMLEVLGSDRLDVFDTDSDVPRTAAAPVRGDGSCSFAALGAPLTLTEAVERALCGHPRTRQAWAEIKASAAALGAAEGAYLPTLSGQAQGIRDDTKTKLPKHAVFDSGNIANTYSTVISLSWVLYDFGGREAALDNATELLAAAKANHDSALQTVFAALAKDYYAAEAAQAILRAAEETERSARGSLDLATRLVRIGTSAKSDALQAETAYVQAGLDRARAEGNARTALGALAGDMMLRPDTAITLPDGEGPIKPDQDFQETVSALIDDAVLHHPDIRSAEAQVRAAEAKIDQTKAEGLPRLSLVGRSARDDQPVNESLGQPYWAATHTDNYLGFQVTVPLFEGFVRDYQIRQARAEAEARHYALEGTRQQVALDVWTAFQGVQTATQTLDHAARLLDIATRSFDVAQHQYAIGDGTMIELLNAQSALAAARRQKIQSQADWRTSRVELAGKLGHLGMFTVEDQ